ncbi:MAG: hypothetical protein NTW04_04970 [Elusimicrobia bacterium]|nr:hypothetical protein [Elusimicrobiota bacterium]
MPILRLKSSAGTKKRNSKRPRSIHVHKVSGNSASLIDNSASIVSPSLGKNFFQILSFSGSVADAVRKSGAAMHELFSLLRRDKNFRAEFEAVLNQRLEISAIDSALKGKISVLSFLLCNRLPAKYKNSQHISSVTREIPPIHYIPAEKKPAKAPEGKHGSR